MEKEKRLRAFCKQLAGMSKRDSPISHNDLELNGIFVDHGEPWTTKLTQIKGFLKKKKKKIYFICVSVCACTHTHRDRCL